MRSPNHSNTDRVSAIHQTGKTSLGDDHLILRGGGGGLALLVGTDYLISSHARPENLFPGKLRTEYLFSTATNF